MIKMLKTIPDEVTIAISGGLDSMVITEFLNNPYESRKVKLLHFNHSEGNSDETEVFVREYALANKLELKVHTISPEVPKHLSREEYWRIERYKVFHRIDGPVITGHHLDDCVETWIWSSLHGEGKLIPYSNKNVIRPFLLTSKADLNLYAAGRKGIRWIEDESNKDNTLMRNYIRNVLMPHALKVNPGIAKVIKKKLEKEYLK